MVAGHSVEFVNRELETVSKQLLSGDVTVVGEQSDGEGWGRKELPQQTSEMTLQWCQRLRLEGKTLKNTVFHKIPFPNFLDCNSRLLSLVEVFRCSQWQPVRERKAKVNSKNIWCCHRVRPNVPGTTKDSGVAFNFFYCIAYNSLLIIQMLHWTWNKNYKHRPVASLGLVLPGAVTHGVTPWTCSLFN